MLRILNSLQRLDNPFDLLLICVVVEQKFLKLVIVLGEFFRLESRLDHEDLFDPDGVGDIQLLLD